MDQSSYSEALAAFKRDCNENAVIARLLRERFGNELLAPVLDIGAGSGEVASLAFPHLQAFLIDLDLYDAPANPNHKRINVDFMHVDFSLVQPSTILFCHSLYPFAYNAQALSRRVAASGARIALVVSNEQSGILKEITKWMPGDASRHSAPFHVPVPNIKLERREPFSAQLRCADFRTLARHVVRVLIGIPLNPALVSTVDQRLRSALAVPHIEIEEAIYCYRLRQ